MHNNPLLNSKLVDWLLSKHVLIFGYDDDVRFAGEAWMKHQLTRAIMHLNNNSGACKPNDQHLIKAAQFLSDTLLGLNVQIHQSANLPSSPSEKIHQQQNQFFTFKNFFIIFLAFDVWIF